MDGKRQTISQFKQTHYQEPKIDINNFVEEYRILKQHQKNFMTQINMPAKFKQEIFGCQANYAQVNNDKLVAFIDPFKGRLIIKEKDWLKIYKEREAQHKKLEAQFELEEEKRRKNREIEKINKEKEKLAKMRGKEKNMESGDKQNDQLKSDQNEDNQIMKKDKKEGPPRTNIKDKTATKAKLQKKQNKQSSKKEETEKKSNFLDYFINLGNQNDNQKQKQIEEPEKQIRMENKYINNQEAQDIYEEISDIPKDNYSIPSEEARQFVNDSDIALTEEKSKQHAKKSDRRP